MSPPHQSSIARGVTGLKGPGREEQVEFDGVYHIASSPASNILPNNQEEIVL